MTRIDDPLQILKRGATKWNKFIDGIQKREFEGDLENPEIVIEKISFAELNLEGYEFSSITFTDCTFENCTFQECKWVCTEFHHCKFKACLFIGGEGDSCSLNDCDLNDCKIEGLAFGESTTRKCRFDSVDFEDCDWDGATFDKDVYSRCILIKSNFEECDFDACRFHFTNLWQSSFKFCSFDEVSLSGSDFIGIMGNSALRFPKHHDAAEMYEDSERTPDGCQFFSCTVSAGNMAGLDFGESDLTGTSFYRCDLSTADLSACRGLATGVFRYSDVAGTKLPMTVSFEGSVLDLRESNVGVQRLAYFSIFVSFSAVVGTLSDFSSTNRIKFPSLGFELAPVEFSFALVVILLALQAATIIRAEHVAARAAQLPAMLPDHASLPSKIRDSFVSDICWRFLYTPAMYPRFARRPYDALTIIISLFVLYFQFPATVLVLTIFSFIHSDNLWTPFALTNLSLASTIFAFWGVFSIIATLRNDTMTGRLRPGGTIVEATAGNTGLGLALVGARKGYRIVLVVPDKMAREKILHCKAMGAEVVLTRSDVGKGHPDYYQDLADAITARTDGAIYINQFGNPANPRAHEQTTGPEILRQMEGAVDAIVVGVGSGGTLAGIGGFMRRSSPKTEMILADPVGSVLAPYVKTGRITQAGSWMVEGIGEDFIPPNADLSLVHDAYSISDQESFATARELLQAEGVFAGSSSGTLLAAALRYCRAQSEPRRVVSLVCDSGAKYLSKVFSDSFLAQEGFIERKRQGTARDLVINRYPDGEVIGVGPDDPLRTVFVRMRSADLSQLPVIERDRVIGIIDESDILGALITEGGERGFERPARDVMVQRLETISADAPIAELIPLFRAGHVGIVMDGERFLGLATPFDLINHFRTAHQ